MGALNKDKEEGFRGEPGSRPVVRSSSSVLSALLQEVCPGLTEPHSDLGPRGRRCPEPEHARGAFPEAELECLLSLLFPEADRSPFPVAGH